MYNNSFDKDTSIDRYSRMSIDTSTCIEIANKKGSGRFKYSGIRFEYSGPHRAKSNLATSSVGYLNQSGFD